MIIDKPYYCENLKKSLTTSGKTVFNYNVKNLKKAEGLEFGKEVEKLFFVEKGLDIRYDIIKTLLSKNYLNYENLKKRFQQIGQLVLKTKEKN